MGNQAETLRRLALHAEAMRACRALGARVVVPIQRGAWAAAQFDDACAAALGFDDFVRGIPGNKVAMPADELEAFLRARRPAAVHLLGVGLRGATFEPLTTLVRRILGDVDVSCDSNALAASAGRTNGAGGGPRKLTALQDIFLAPPAAGSWPESWVENAREMAVSFAFGPTRMHELVMEQLRLDGFVARRQADPLQMDLFDRVVAPI